MKAIKNNTLLWITLTVIGLLFVGLLVVGNTTARAQGGDCIVKIGEFCLRDVVSELEEITGISEPEIDEGFTAGALVGNELQGNSWTVGERQEKAFGIRMRQASSTLCQIIPSTTGTTTLQNVGVLFDIGSSTAIVVTVSRGTIGDNNSSTTPLWEFSHASDIKGAYYMSTSTTPTEVPVVDDIMTFAPNQPLLVTQSLGIGPDGGSVTGLGFVPFGGCDAEFLRHNF